MNTLSAEEITPDIVPARPQSAMWHETGLPADVTPVREQVRASVARHVAPTAPADDDARADFPWTEFRGLAGDGLFALPFEAPLGRGLEHRFLASCIAIEEIAYESSGLAGVYGSQCLLMPQALVFARDELRAELLPELTSGAKVFSFVTAEAEAGGARAPDAMATTIDPVAGGYRLNGAKRWITYPTTEAWAAVLGRFGDVMTMVMVDLGSDGVSFADPVVDLRDGLQVPSTVDVIFEDVFVPDERVLGQPGKGLRIALSTLSRGRIGIGAAGVGVAQAAIDLAADRLGDERTFGRRLGELEHWHYQLAEKAIELEGARLLYQKAALRLDLGAASADPEASMAKSLGTRLANDLARDALQIFGGPGFTRRVSLPSETRRLEEIHRDAKLLEVFEGASEGLLWVIARELLGRDLTG
jgi:alkylation response protein AidB-like acyl-CoA dehydrogenase